MPIISVPGTIVVPFGTADKWSVYINGIDYSDYVTYFNIIKKINELESFEIKIMDIISSDANVKYGNDVLILSETNLVVKGRIEIIGYGTDGITTIKGLGKGVRVRNKEVSGRQTYEDTKANDIVVELLSEKNNSASPWIVKPGFMQEGDVLTFRSEFANKLEAINNLATQSDWDWYVTNGDAKKDKPPFSTDYFNFEAWRGSPAPVYNFYVSGNNQNCILTQRSDNFIDLANKVTVLGSGDGINQLTSTCYAASTIYSRISTDTNVARRTGVTAWINLDDTTKFPNSGTIRIGNEVASFSSNSGNALYSLGDTNTTAHVKGTSVYLIYDGTYARSLDQEVSLDRDTLATDTTIYVAGAYPPSIEPFLDSGKIIIGDEIISYTGKDTINVAFTGCTRGATDKDDNSTIARSHLELVGIFQYYESYHYTPLSPQSGSPIDVNGLHEKKIIEKTIDDQSYLDLYATQYLEKNKSLTYEIIIDIMEPFEFFKNIAVGDNVIITDSDTGLSSTYRIQGFELRFDDAGEKMLVTASNKRVISTTFTDNIASIGTLSDTHATFAQGSTFYWPLHKNIIIIDATDGFIGPIRLGSDVISVNSVKLNYKIISGSPTDVDVGAGVYGSENLVGSYTGDQTDIDITDYFDFLGNGAGWYNVILTPNGSDTEFDVDIFIKGFVHTKE